MLLTIYEVDRDLFVTMGPWHTPFYQRYGILYRTPAHTHTAGFWHAGTVKLGGLSPLSPGFYMTKGTVAAR